MENTQSIKGTSSFQDLGLNPATSEEKESSEKTDFLELFVAQLRNQNPLEPQEGADFLAQLAQFSTVEGIQNMQSSFSGLASSLQSSHALQASSLVGREVEIKSDKSILYEDAPLRGSVHLPQTVTDLKLSIQTLAGEEIQSIDLPGEKKGEYSFSWDGGMKDGTQAQAGIYQIVASGTSLGQNTQFETYVPSKVDSVTLNQPGQGMLLNILGHGSVPIEDVQKII